MTIARDPEEAAQAHYDLIVVGGGIYGAMLALEATLRGLSVLVLEKEDFGGATSYNSLRIIHGGLRDLQHLNLKRYWTFGRERRWFLDRFPDLVEPLPVLVPLYQQGWLRTDVFRIAFLADRLLLPQEDRAAAQDVALPYGTVLSASEVKRRFPEVDERRLNGGALWYDAAVPDSQRLIIEVLRCACHMGATALNYLPATELRTRDHRVAGVCGRDVVRGAHFSFSADAVVNATGPWRRATARRLDRRLPDPYYPSMAWNVLFDRAAPSRCALGVKAPRPGGQMYFLHPWKGRLLAGTGHAPRTQRRDAAPRPTAEEVDAFVQGLNEAVPALHLTRQDILHVFAGYLPVEERGTVQLARSDRFVDHAAHGGPDGLYSIESTKFTAARCTAEAVLARLFPNRRTTAAKEQTFRRARGRAGGTDGVFDYHWSPDPEKAAWRTSLRRIIENESVYHLDDLMLRRTSLGDNPMRAFQMVPELCALFDWSEERCREEAKRIERHFRWIHTRLPEEM